MDLEGIYRKVGGNGQVKAIQEGFEKSDDYDISDPSIDISAVTSVLKQYFRRLPTPLLTFDVYDKVLESNCQFCSISTFYLTKMVGASADVIQPFLMTRSEQCS
jgi:hypothetical protein